MNTQSKVIYLAISSGIFLLVSLLHFLRVLYGLEVVIGGWSLPLSLSVVATIGPLILSIWGFSLIAESRSIDKH